MGIFVGLPLLTGTCLGLTDFALAVSWIACLASIATGGPVPSTVILSVSAVKQQIVQLFSPST